MFDVDFLFQGTLIVLSLVAVQFCTSVSEDKTAAQSRIGGYQNVRPAKQEASFMSKLASWFFPFGGSDDVVEDAVPAEGQGRGRFIPPPPRHREKPACNPCNSVPWVPVASNSGHHTFIQFKPPNPSSQEHFKEVSASNYGPPAATDPGFGTLSIPSGNYGPASVVLPSGPSTISLNIAPPPLSNGRYHGSHDQSIAASQQVPSKQKPKSSFAKPYKFVPVKFAQPPRLELRPKPPNPGPPVTYRPQTADGNRFEVQKEPPLGIDNFAAPIEHRPVTYVVPPAFQFGALPPQQFYDLPQNTRTRGPFVPLPNLSLRPVLPIHSAHDFHTGFPQQSAQVTLHDVEVQPSIPIAGYLATVEHPVNVIQSPLVEVTVKEAIGNAGVAETTTSADNQLQHDFKQRPVVVAESDAHTAETSSNGTFHEPINNKRGNDANLATFSFHKEQQDFDVTKENEYLIRQILNSQTFPATTQATATTSPSQFSLKKNRTQFTVAPLHHQSSWTPSLSVSSLPDKMLPPPEGTSPWLNSVTTKRPKQIQVIVPYITNQKPTPFKNQYLTSSGTVKPANYEKLPVYFTPPTKGEPVWRDWYAQQESQKIFSAQKPLIHASNIRELLKGEIELKQHATESLPFDIITLQKTIDDWTQQEFSNKLSTRDEIKSTTKLGAAKMIPNEFFATKTYASTESDRTTPRNINNRTHYDHSVASSNQKETSVSREVEEVESNLVLADATTREVGTSRSTTATESVYIVTAKPYLGAAGNITHKTPTFAIRLESENHTKNSNETEKVIYSEWPHLSAYRMLSLEAILTSLSS